MACHYCTDPDGLPCFPMYGQGPHRHAQGPVSGPAVQQAAAEWPDNYQEDPDCPGMGVWWCPDCGDGKPSAAEPTSHMEKNNG